MRQLGAVLIGLMLIVAVGVAYNQCSGGACGGDSAAATCPSAASTCPSGSGGGCATCPAKADCDGDCATCECPAKADCDGDCATCECPAKADCDGDCATCECPAKADCATCECPAKADCDGDCATCECPKCATCDKADKSSCHKISGTVRYTRATNKAVKVMVDEKGYLLRIGGECGGCPQAMMQTIAGLEKGDAVKASFQVEPDSGKYYICSLSPVVKDEPPVEEAPAPPAPPAAAGG